MAAFGAAFFFAPAFFTVFLATAFLTVFLAATFFLAGAFVALVAFFALVIFFALVGMAHILPLYGSVRKIADARMSQEWGFVDPFVWQLEERQRYHHCVMSTKRAPSAPLLLGLALSLGCATAPPMASPLAEPLPPPDETAARTTTASPAFRHVHENGDANDISGPDDLANLCRALRDEASMSFAGNTVEQARASEAHADHRQQASVARYVTIIPASGFAFRAYDIDERKLALDTDRNLVLGDGAELFIPSKDPAPGFVVGPELANRILAQHATDKVALRLLFRPARSELRKDGCMWLSGGGVVKMEVEVLATALVAPDGNILSRGDTGDYADSMLAAPVRAPQVTVGKPRAADGKEIPASLSQGFAALAAQAQSCYEQALAARPALRGTMVLAIRIAAAGRIESPHVEISSLGDDTLSKCVASRAATAKLLGASAGQRYSIPLQFSSSDDR